MKVKILSCSDKQYWYWELVGETISITGEKVVDDRLHERLFVPDKDEGVPLTQVSYLTSAGRYLCAKDVEI